MRLFLKRNLVCLLPALGVLWLLWLLGCAAHGAQTNLYYVNHVNVGEASPPYDSWDTAATNIRHAVDQALEDWRPGTNFVVLVADGWYRLDGEIVLSRDIELRGVNGMDAVIVDGGFPAVTNRCLFVTNSHATVRGFTFTNGYASGTGYDRMGGGILVADSDATIENCRIRLNRAEQPGSGGYGGGLAIVGGAPLVRGCVIEGNSTVNTGSGVQYGTGLYINNSRAFVYDCIVSNNVQQGNNGSGAGLYMSSSANGMVSNCQFIANSSSRYGGNYVFGGTLTHCLFSNNYARSAAGGLYLYGSTTGSRLFHSVAVHNRVGNGAGGGISINRGILENCLILFNEANGAGGGVNNSEGTIKNCLILGNRATGNGGGLYRNNKSHTVRNCTIAQNEGKVGGGVYNASTYANNLLNSIVFNNRADEANQDYCGVSDTAIGYSCAPELVANENGNLASDPRFVNSGSGTGLDAIPGDHTLRAGSPCRDSGFFESWMPAAVDLRGYPRILPETEGRVDMGAFEHIPVPGGTLMYLR